VRRNPSHTLAVRQDCGATPRRAQGTLPIPQPSGVAHGADLRRGQLEGRHETYKQSGRSGTDSGDRESQRGNRRPLLPNAVPPARAREARSAPPNDLETLEERADDDPESPTRKLSRRRLSPRETPRRGSTSSRNLEKSKRASLCKRREDGTPSRSRVRSETEDAALFLRRCSSGIRARPRF